MNDSPSNKILATVSAADFVGRAGETETLRRHAGGETKSRGLLLLSAPAAGASEILKQTYDRFSASRPERFRFISPSKNPTERRKIAPSDFCKLSSRKPSRFVIKSRKSSVLRRTFANSPNSPRRRMATGLTVWLPPVKAKAD